MRDYMTALQRRFHIMSERAAELGHEVEAAYDTLHDSLSKDQKKLLLRYLTAEDSFRDEQVIDAFCSGFKLADGIRRELGEPYSYEAENEARARNIFRRELEQNE